MIALLQRVSDASVSVSGETIASIGRGLLVLACVEPGDCERQARRLAERVCGYRIFPDTAGRMNLSVGQAAGALLLVPQFTLAADTDKGMRPSFTKSADPAKGKALFLRLVAHCREINEQVQTGEFGENMQVRLTNDGPVTFLLRVRPADGA